MIYRSAWPEPEIPDLSLSAFVLEHAVQRGAHPALRDGVSGATITYAELASLVERAARVLVATGVRSGEVVALLSPNDPWWVVAFHTVLSAGAVVTPMNPALTPEEIETQLRASRAVLVLVHESVEEKARKAGAACGIAVIVIDRGRDDDSLRARTEAQATAPAAAVVTGDRSADTLAVLPYSSGTTGLPKGVMLTHRNLVATLVQHESLYRVQRDDVFLASLPLFHIYGLSIIMNYALRHGATLVTMPRFQVEDFFSLIERERVSWLHVAPPVVLRLTGPEAVGRDLTSVRRAVSGAAPLDPDLSSRAEARLGCRIGQGYGMTEASPGITFVPDDEWDMFAEGSVGVLVAGTEARLVDPETGLDTDTQGELWIRGPQVMAGYLDNQEATDATVVEDGWLRTGDIARVDGSGCWWIVDRLKELIKYKGYQIAPAELEAVLLRHPGIADAAVIGLADDEAGEVPLGFVVAASGSADDIALTADAVKAWMAERVAPYKKLRRVELVDRIPKSPSGKILRRELRAWAIDELSTNTGGAP